ncbi:Non-structural NS1 [Gossypium arboreum]|uniref:Non-structural NS1 n=1 Tax=Gossypium arboreum TaxID=29729 RepID=A0A0B0PFQ5_GOSAR|nr:Non-structural NS1 [Gossypium arboreum]
MGIPRRMMRTPELVVLSPSSLMGRLHGSLATYAAFMCKLSMYPSYIPMCSTGKILVKWKILKMQVTYCVDKPARKSETVGGTLTLSVYHLDIMACIF